MKHTLLICTALALGPAVAFAQAPGKPGKYEAQASAAKPLPEAMAPTMILRRVTSIVVPPHWFFVGNSVSQTLGVSSLAQASF